MNRIIGQNPSTWPKRQKWKQIARILNYFFFLDGNHQNFATILPLLHKVKCLRQIKWYIGKIIQ